MGTGVLWAIIIALLLLWALAAQMFHVSVAFIEALFFFVALALLCQLLAGRRTG